MNTTGLTINETDNFTNNASLEKSGGYFFEENGECPRYIVYGFLVFYLLGSCVNLLECLALMRYKRNGLLSILLQITLVDTVLFLTALIDLSGSYYQTWKFSGQICMLYGGTDLLTNTLIVYLLVCLNFHIITFWNLHNVEKVRNNRNPLTSFNESSSSECLVTRSDNRLITIDYRKRKNDVSVAFPVVFLWILCLSISMPKYVLSAIVQVQGRTLCVILQNAYGNVLHALLIIFSATLPCFLLVISLIILIYKLSKTSKKDIENVLTKQFDEIRRLLIFSIVLSTFYIITSYQRHVYHITITIKEFFFFDNCYFNNFQNVYQIMLHYTGSSLRGLICYVAIPNVRLAVRDKLFCYNKEVE